MSGVLAVYLLTAGVVGLTAALAAGLSTDPQERRVAARVALTFWAWPIWLVVAGFHAGAYLVRTAR